MWCWCHCHNYTQRTVITVFPLAHRTRQSRTGTEESHVHIAAGVHIRLWSSNTTFNHVSDCSVLCMNRTINPPAAVTSTTVTENVIVKLIKMLLPLECGTGTNWLRTEQSKRYATGHRILYLQYSTNDEITETWIEAKWKAKVGDGEEVGQNTDSGRAGIYIRTLRICYI